MAQTFTRPPSSLDRTQFVALHGRVYEHSPWIAETAWSAGLKPQHDTVEGLHQALATIVDAAPRARQFFRSRWSFAAPVARSYAKRQAPIARGYLRDLTY